MSKNKPAENSIILSVANALMIYKYQVEKCKLPSISQL